MKKMILILLLGTFFYPAFSQYNTELIDENKLWTTINASCMPGWHTSEYHKFEGDTLINDTTYTIVWQSNIESQESWYIKGFIREDNQQRYYFRNNTGYEGMIYDFDVNVGDIIAIDNPFHYTIVNTEVLEIDSVMLEPGGVIRKRIKLAADEFGIDEYWIKGVGSSAGVLMSGFHVIMLTGGQWYALCHWENNDLIYTNPLYSFCFETTVGTEEFSEKDNEVQVIPSPVTESSDLKISIDDQGVYNLEIYDMYGKRIMNNMVQAESKISIQRSDFQPGMYVVVLIKENKLIARSKYLVL